MQALNLAWIRAILRCTTGEWSSASSQKSICNSKMFKEESFDATNRHFLLFMSTSARLFQLYVHNFFGRWPAAFAGRFEYLRCVQRVAERSDRKRRHAFFDSRRFLLYYLQFYRAARQFS